MVFKGNSGGAGRAHVWLVICKPEPRTLGLWGLVIVMCTERLDRMESIPERIIHPTELVVNIEVSVFD